MAAKVPRVQVRELVPPEKPMRNRVQNLRLIVVVGLFLGIAGTLSADEKARRQKAILDDRSNLKADARWVYNDLESGFKLAKETGKPMLVVLRCVPCKACTGMDESVLRAKDLQPMLDQFVCVRVVNANTLDLNRFQFDYDLSFSTLFFNADGTLYGRFGSWQHQLDELEVSTAGFQASLVKALTIHEGYPNNQTALAPKQGRSTPFAVPVEIPGLAGKYGREVQWDSDKVVQSCVHCHQIGDAFRAWHRERKELIPADLVFPMPEPKTIGINIDPRTTGTIRSLESSSIAEKCGFQKQDQIVAIDGAPIMSVADIAWALHSAPESGNMRWTVMRDDQKHELDVALPLDWRYETDISSRVGTWEMRAMVLGGMVLKPASPEQRATSKLEAGELGLVVKHVGEYAKHAAAKNAGFQKGDILVSVEGIHGTMTESRLIGELLRLYPSKGSAKVIVVRDGKRIPLTLPIQ